MRLSVWVLINLAFVNVLYAQTDKPVDDKSGFHAAVEKYFESSLHRSKLLNGTLYKEPTVTNESHPYYEKDDWQPASLNYASDSFAHVDVMYDLHSDNLIIEHPSNASKIQLIKLKVKSFRIGRRHFIHMGGTALSATLPKSGFYQVVYPGNTMCLARWSKTVDREATEGKIELHYRERITYFVAKGVAFSPVKSKASLLRLLSDHKKEVKHHISQNDLRWSNREQIMSDVLSFYDSLSEK